MVVRTRAEWQPRRGDHARGEGLSTRRADPSRGVVESKSLRGQGGMLNSDETSLSSSLLQAGGGIALSDHLTIFLPTLEAVIEGWLLQTKRSQSGSAKTDRAYQSTLSS